MTTTLNILTVLAAIGIGSALVAGLAWVNYYTNGALGWIFLLF